MRQSSHLHHSTGHSLAVRKCAGKPRSLSHENCISFGTRYLTHHVSLV